MASPAEPAEAVKPVRPCAPTVRAHLKAAGQEHMVKAVNTGRRRCWVRLHWPDDPDASYAEQIATTLRELWNDGDRRVRAVHGATVVIDVAGYGTTAPNTPEGLAYLAQREADRNEQLLRAQRDGGRIYATNFTPVRYEPTDADPHRPWTDRSGNRYNPFTVHLMA